MTTSQQAPPEAAPSRIAHTIRLFAVPIVLFWVAVAALTNVLVPPLESSAKPTTSTQLTGFALAAGLQTHRPEVRRVQLRQSAMVVLEGDQPLGAGRPPLLRRPGQANRAGTPRTSSTSRISGRPADGGGSQSADGKAAYVQVFLAGNQGEANPWNPSTRCGRSSPRRRPHRGCGRYVTGRPRRSPISSSGQS